MATATSCGCRLVRVCVLGLLTVVTLKPLLVCAIVIVGGTTDATWQREGLLMASNILKW